MIFMPPVHFSNLTVQRGTIAPIVGVAGMPIPVLMEPGMPIVVGPIVVGASIVLVMVQTPLCVSEDRLRPTPTSREAAMRRQALIRLVASSPLAMATGHCTFGGRPEKIDLPIKAVGHGISWAMAQCTLALPMSVAGGPSH
jgi:hypothetical protein